MSSNLYFLANNINPFMGLLGLSQSFSFLILAGEGGGGDPLAWVEATELVEVGTFPKIKADPPIARGEVKSFSPAAGEENSKRLKRSQRSGVRMASGWLGGRQRSPTDKS